VVAAVVAGTVAGRALAVGEDIRMAGWGAFWATLVDNWLYRTDDLRRIEAKLDLLIRATGAGGEQ